MSEPQLRVECVPIDSCVGKTIKAVCGSFGNVVTIGFTDGSVVCLRATPSYDDSAEFDNLRRITVHDVDIDRLAALGIISTEVVATYRAEMREWAETKQARKEADERAKLKELLAKYGSEGGAR